MEHLKCKLLSLDTHNYNSFTSDLRFHSTSYPLKPYQPFCLSPCGSLLALGQADYSVQLRHTKTQKLKGVLGGHGNHVISVHWSKDGKYLASGGLDK